MLLSKFIERSLVISGMTGSSSVDSLPILYYLLCKKAEGDNMAEYFIINLFLAFSFNNNPDVNVLDKVLPSQRLIVIISP